MATLSMLFHWCILHSIRGSLGTMTSPVCVAVALLKCQGKGGCYGADVRGLMARVEKGAAEQRHLLVG